mmetsp:Transcript_25469/g.74799  ORF Transcript_25469/g.74799 Transcript_25469/m.74799 type:complete len:322 (-) Transcript_25469:864-1829(-)
MAAPIGTSSACSPRAYARPAYLDVDAYGPAPTVAAGNRGEGSALLPPLRAGNAHDLFSPTRAPRKPRTGGPRGQSPRAKCRGWRAWSAACSTRAERVRRMPGPPYQTRLLRPSRRERPRGSTGRSVAASARHRGGGRERTRRRAPPPPVPRARLRAWRRGPRRRSPRAPDAPLPPPPRSARSPPPPRPPAPPPRRGTPRARGPGPGSPRTPCPAPGARGRAVWARARGACTPHSRRACGSEQGCENWAPRGPRGDPPPLGRARRAARPWRRARRLWPGHWARSVVEPAALARAQWPRRPATRELGDRPSRCSLRCPDPRAR